MRCMVLLAALFVLPGAAAILRARTAERGLSPVSSSALAVGVRAANASSSTAMEGAMAAATASVNASHNTSHNASHNASSGRLPFDPRVEPAVGKVFALYYSDWSKAQVTSVEAREDYYKPATRPQHVWQGSVQLPVPSCGLQLTTQSNYPTDRRKANLRLAELAICELYTHTGKSLPSCGAGTNEVCELSIFTPIPSTDEHEEPYIAAAVALAAYSKLCALGQSSTYNHYKCEVHRSMSAVCAGFELVGGQPRLVSPPAVWQLDDKLTDAYVLNMEHVYLADESKTQYYKSDDYKRRGDPLGFNHEPPAIGFCENLACLVDDFIIG